MRLQGAIGQVMFLASGALLLWAAFVGRHVEMAAFPVYPSQPPALPPQPPRL
jgi:hypothetical protein